MQELASGGVAIEVHKLSKSFGPVLALRSVSLKIATGQIYGLLGPNGAGKTTFIRLLTGSTRPSGGSISVLGLDPTRQKQQARRQIGYMPQSPSLYEDLTPVENIRFFGRGRRQGDLARRVDEVIAFVGLRERANDAVYTFSGGMKQRLSLACALVNRPPVLLLDEPTSGIDPQLRESFWAHFRDMASHGTTILISTHQMDEALYCDRLAVLNRGVLLADDSPKQLLWQENATVRIWRAGEVVVHDLADYPNTLPGLLQEHGLDVSISRIEVDVEDLGRIVLRKIDIQDRNTGGDDHAGNP